MRSLLLGTLALLVSACQTAGSSSALPPEANRLRPDHAPTPFGAEEIRAGCPEGRWNLFTMRTTGKMPVWSLSRFVRSDAEGAEFSTENVNEDGLLIGEPVRGAATWTELQGHASFPAANTEIRRARRRVAAGDFDCWLYVFREVLDGKSLVHRFWFARSLPGSPIRVEQEEGGQLIFEMELLKTGRDEPAPR
ncbi:MAG: hypothetical protein AB1726_10990 [Planctomycetota bacterium]